MKRSQIPVDAIRRAARALNTHESSNLDKWEDLTRGEKYYFTKRAQIALSAAAPLISDALLESLRVEVGSLAAQRDAIGDDDYEPDEDDGDCRGDAGECHRSGAMASYARVMSLLTRWSAELRGES
jgi:hypothetical protein